MIRYGLILPKNAKVISSSVTNVFIFNFQKSQSFEKLYVSIPPSGNTELFNYSRVVAYGLAPADRLLVSRAKLVQTSHLKTVGECRPGNADYLLSVAI